MAGAYGICALAAAFVVSVALSDGHHPDWTKSCKSTQTADEVLNGVDLTGKRIIYTGGDGNIASESTLALAKVNASLILACRNASKCKVVRDNIIAKIGITASIEVEQLDLSSRHNVMAFATRVMSKHPKIDVLINSAATYGTFTTGDHLVGAMEVNLLGPALLSHLLLPAFRGHGRVVNVAAAAYDPPFLTENTTVDDLLRVCKSVDPTVNYYGLSKFLMVHHAVELAKREPNVTVVALAPGVAIPLPNFPNWFKHGFIHFPYPESVLNLFDEDVRHYIRACTTNLAGLASCPETLAQGAGVVSAIASWPEVDQYSGSYFDYDTKPLPDDAPQEYGHWTQSDPTCVPREPDHLDEDLRAEWYDEMLRLMILGTSNSPSAAKLAAV